MKYTEKRLEQFDIRKVLPFTMGYAQRYLHEMESTVADKINAEVNYAIAQAEQEGYQRGVKEARSHYYERVRMEAEQEMLKRVVGEIEEIHTALHNGKMEVAYKLTCDLLSSLDTLKTK